ncbi:LANO_0G05534g1_1 [Lachancea nothofagi CBS 11611]|uniref:LANO_0G05534g1_1 n=1 Tax=Lachancea nothofagi CBS 11611 TaxID=1266666 RepID=A0A1G4KGU7_9SACH|nr:LANO_0G05534g1_1 [Lachancea nothofagi CBS 11611]
MSLFRSLQNQPRIITLFTHDVASNPSTLIMQQLRAGPAEKYDIEVHTKFPTLDQLKYLNGIDGAMLQSQIPKLASLMHKDSSFGTFGKDLRECVKLKDWNASSSLWVDWEKRKMGNDASSVKSLLEKL